MIKPRRLDHVAIVVRETETALAYFSEKLGLEIARSEEIPYPKVRLTYLDAGNAYIQLVEPLDTTSEIAQTLANDGEGLHHICFGVEDVLGTAHLLAESRDLHPQPGSGRGRVSAFVPGGAVFGVRIEFTEFRYEEDVEASEGWLP